MPTFHHLRLRSTGPWGHVVWLWLTLSLLAAAATPLLQPQAADWVCSSAGGVQLVRITKDGMPALDTHAADCPLCLPVQALQPDPPALLAPPLPQPLHHALQPVVAARMAALTAAPLPARGPPSLS